MFRLRYITALIILSVAIIGLSPIFTLASSDKGKWTEQKITKEEFIRKYGAETEQISEERAEEILLMLVNKVRKEAGLIPLRPNAIARRAGYAHAREMATNHFISHLSLNGDLPIKRFNRVGGTDHISENLAYWEWGLDAYLTEKLVEDIFNGWMESEGHRKNILNPVHNQVGIAIYIERTESRTTLTAAQEFVDDYADFEKIPSRISANDKLRIAGNIQDGFTFDTILIARDDFPKPQKPDVLNSELSGYKLPNATLGILPFSEKYIRKLKDLPTAYYVNYDRARNRVHGEFSISEAFMDAYGQDINSPSKAMNVNDLAKPGLYYIFIVVKGEEGKSFVASTQAVEVY